MFRTFKPKVGHFALDDARIGAVAAFGQRVTCEIMLQAPLFKGPSLDSINRRFWAELETDFVRMALTKGEGLPLAPPAAA